ncbi:unnamed protein product [Caenorhabditis angaria]|uniref:Uncharacterized protein n=1 Tax=Caenorhabditis angaria TaxID=860376 RepID=A0A9P1I814_9PELO|nr:unnamed protein product [Caenorhabditis angaria]
MTFPTIFLLTILLFLIPTSYCGTLTQIAKIGERVEVLTFETGPLTKDDKYTFNFSGPNRGFFTDDKTKKRLLGSNLQIKENGLIITKVTKNDAGWYQRGATAFTLIVE